MFAPPRRYINSNLEPIRGNRRKGGAGNTRLPSISIATTTTTTTDSAAAVSGGILQRSSSSCTRSRGLLESSQTTLDPSMSSRTSFISEREQSQQQQQQREQCQPSSLYPVKVPTGITQRHGSFSSAETTLQGTVENKFYQQQQQPPRRMVSERTLLLTERSRAGPRKREDIGRIEAQQRSVRPRLQPCHKYQQPLRRSQTMDNTEHLRKRTTAAGAGCSSGVRRRHSLVTTQREISSTVQLSNVIELQQRVDYLTRQLGIKQQIIDGLLKDNVQLRGKVKEYDEKSRSRPFNVNYMNDIPIVPVEQHQHQQQQQQSSSPMMQESSRIDMLSSGHCSPLRMKIATPSPPPTTTASCSPILGLESISLEGRDSMLFDRPMHIRESIQQLHTSLQYATNTLHE